MQCIHDIRLEHRQNKAREEMKLADENCPVRIERD